MSMNVFVNVETGEVCVMQPDFSLYERVPGLDEDGEKKIMEDIDVGVGMMMYEAANCVNCRDQEWEDLFGEDEDAPKMDSTLEKTDNGPAVSPEALALARLALSKLAQEYDNAVIWDDYGGGYFWGGEEIYYMAAADFKHYCNEAEYIYEECIDGFVEVKAYYMKEEAKRLKEKAKDLKEEAEGLKEEAKNLKEAARRLKEKAEDLEEETEGLEWEAKDPEEKPEYLKWEAKDWERRAKNLEEEAEDLEEEAEGLKEEAKDWEEAAKDLKKKAKL